MTGNEYLMHFFHAIGDTLDESNAAAFIANLRDRSIITEREAAIIKTAVCGSALDKAEPEVKNNVRADIMRHIIMSLMN